MSPAELKETVLARGHKNVLAEHETTVATTKEVDLSWRGDCIIAVDANKAVGDLRPEFKEKLRTDGVRVAVVVEAGGSVDTINAYGSSRLVLTHPSDLVIRKSSYVCPRTLAVHADKSASELSRDLVRELRDPGQSVKITIVTLFR